MTGPVRTCVGCGQAAAQQALVRVRVGDGACVVVDVKRSGGRGAWLHGSAGCLERAVKRRAFARAFRRGDLACDVVALRGDLTVVVGRD
jgi:predicted RNA-binding protein YlxR (DUF448 family)